MTLNDFTYVTPRTHLEMIKGLWDYNLFTSGLSNQENEDGHALNTAADCISLYQKGQNDQSNETEHENNRVKPLHSHIRKRTKILTVSAKINLCGLSATVSSFGLITAG